MIQGRRRAPRRWACVAVACAGAAAAFGCGGRERAAQPGEVPTIIVSGCAPVRAGPVCGLPADRTLRIWTSRRLAPEQPFRADGHALGAREAKPAGEGWLQTFEVPATARQLRVEGPKSQAGWSIR